MGHRQAQLLEEVPKVVAELPVVVAKDLPRRKPEGCLLPLHPPRIQVAPDPPPHQAILNPNDKKFEQNELIN